MSSRPRPETRHFDNDCNGSEPVVACSEGDANASPSLPPASPWVKLCATPHPGEGTLTMALFDFVKRLIGGSNEAAKAKPAPLPVPVPVPDSERPNDSEAPAVVLTPVSNIDERRVKSRVNARPGTSVLIIDDSATIVALLRRMMKQNSYETFEAEDAESGIELAREHRPGLIFLDIVLPGMNGFEALRRLRRDPLTKDIPIIMISGNEQATEQFYAHRIGADDFMKKPFARAEVFARIERLLDADLMPRRPSLQAQDAEPEAQG